MFPPSGIQMLMKSMGLDPEQLKNQVLQMVELMNSINSHLNGIESRLCTLEQQSAEIREKLING